MALSHVRPAAAVALSFTALVVACGSENAGADSPPPSVFPTPGADPLNPAPPPVASADGGDGAGSVLGTCAEGVTPLTREPSEVLLLVDRSGSMHIKLPSGQTRWQAMKQGLFELLGGVPESIRVGAMVFPQGDPSVDAYCRIDPAQNDVACAAKGTWPEPPETARCAVETYKAGVAPAPLSPAQAKAIEDHISASDSGFFWGTPSAPALRAAIDLEKQSSAGAKSVVVLTDGNPTSCGATSGISNDIANVVDAAYAGAKGTLVRTFVIGIVDNARQAAKAENLSPVAVAGGTARYPGCEAKNDCFYAVTAANFAADIHQALVEIGQQAFDCTFTVPPSQGSVDPASLNVEVTAPGGSYVVPRDPAHADGWDYLPGDKEVQIYGAACKKLADSGTSVKLVAGCKAVVR